MRFESWIDQQIREATERGDFDDLPGAGKPLPDHGRAYDEEWWLRDFLSRHEVGADGLLPPAILLRREVDGLRDEVRDLPSAERVRTVVEALNRRIRQSWTAPDTGRIPVRPVDVEAVLAQWQEDRAAAASAAPPQPPARPVEPARSGRWRRLFRR